MSEPGFSGMPVCHLDPAAQEFFPTTAALPPSPPPQIYYTYSPPPPATYDNMVYTHPPPPPPHYPPVPPPAFAGAEPQRPAPPTSPSPSRTLLLSMVPAAVSESTVRRELEVFGDVRSVQMERRREGLVTVHFYDVRAAQEALLAIQEQHMQQQFRLGRYYEAVLCNVIVAAPPIPPQAARGLISGRVVWAQFVPPVTSGLPDGNNQGTLVVFNLSPALSPPSLREIFERFGPVRELRETPLKKFQRFVEFYDIRDAAAAMAAFHGNSQILGANAVVQFSRPGGVCNRFWRSPPHNGASSRNPNSPSPITPYSSRINSFNSNSRPSPPPRPRPRAVEVKMRPPLPQWRGNPSGSDGSRSSSSGSSSLHGSLSNLCISSGYDGYDECSANNNNNNNNNNSHNNNRRYKKTSSSKKGNSVTSSGSPTTLKQQPGHGEWKGCSGRRGKDHHDPRFLINEDTIVESNCRDSRTTVMIKNIPNKYSQKLLMNMLDNHCIHCNEQMTGGDDQPLSSYDFVYLPIDYINKCNVGYGFVNMTSPEATLRLYKAFHHQSWEVFNSRKICQVTYARLQGVDALREHFKNSKFPCNAMDYMPVVFSPPRDGRVLTDPAPITGCCTAPEEARSDEGVNGHVENSICDEDGDDEEEGYGGRSGGGCCSYEGETDV